MSTRSRRSLGLLAGFVLDAVFADPARWHPVAGFGRLAVGLEYKFWADRRRQGVTHWTVCVGSAVAGGAVLGRLVRRDAAAEVAAMALVTWSVLGGAGLTRTATALADDLEACDLVGARRRLPSLCGRDPRALEAAGIVRAVVESVAENTSDAVVAPLCWGALLGIPGLIGYRAVNTLDAMVGHRSPRYVRFGWAAARADDAANLAPARLTAALFAFAAPVVGGDVRSTWKIARRDARSHPSPNGGWCEAAAAGALGVQLGGTNTYGDAVQHRGLLGDGRPPAVTDIGRAVKLSRTVAVLTVALAVAGVSVAA